MARLLLGEDSKIDMINEYVRLVQCGDSQESEESLKALLDLFKPLILKLCKKWSDYFNINNQVKNFDETINECIYWFYCYTKNKYTINGEATYNKFIKDHLDQRIRYIYECEIKYQNKLLFPDPYKNSDDDNNIFDNIIGKYSSISIPDIIDEFINTECNITKHKLASKIILMLQSNIYNDRERDIFISIVCNKNTHEQLGNKYKVSRTRITQILAKIKEKLYKQIEQEDDIWLMLDDADIDISNPKLI